MFRENWYAHGYVNNQLYNVLCFVLCIYHFYFLLSIDLMLQSLTCEAAVQHAWPSVYRMLDLTVKTRLTMLSNVFIPKTSMQSCMSSGLTQYLGLSNEDLLLFL